MIERLHRPRIRSAILWAIWREIAGEIVGHRDLQHSVLDHVLKFGGDIGLGSVGLTEYAVNRMSNLQLRLIADWNIAALAGDFHDWIARRRGCLAEDDKNGTGLLQVQGNDGAAVLDAPHRRGPDGTSFRIPQFGQAAGDAEGAFQRPGRSFLVGDEVDVRRLGHAVNESGRGFGVQGREIWFYAQRCQNILDLGAGEDASFAKCMFSRKKCPRPRRRSCPPRHRRPDTRTSSGIFGV